MESGHSFNYKSQYPLIFSWKEEALNNTCTFFSATRKAGCTWAHRKKQRRRLSCEYQQLPILQAVTWADQPLSSNHTVSGKARGKSWVELVCKPEEGHPRLLAIKFGFHQLHKTQSSSQPGPEMEKGRSVERQRALPPEPAVTGPTRDVSSSNKYRLFTYTTSNNVLPPGLAQLHSLSTGSQARG